MMPQKKVLYKTFLMHHKKVWKYKFKLIFSLSRIGTGMLNTRKISTTYPHMSSKINIYHRWQNHGKTVKKSSKIGQENKTLDVSFNVIFDH